METLSDATIDELKEKGLEVAKPCGIGNPKMEWENIDPEQFREKKQPEDFEINGNKYYWTKDKEFKLPERLFYIKPETIYEMFFKAVKACKGTEHAWKGEII